MKDDETGFRREKGTICAPEQGGGNPSPQGHICVSGLPVQLSNYFPNLIGHNQPCVLKKHFYTLFDTLCNKLFNQFLVFCRFYQWLCP